MKDLFYSDKEFYTEEGHCLDKLAREAIKPIFIDFIKQGFKVREIEYVIKATITDLALEDLIFNKERN